MRLRVTPGGPLCGDIQVAADKSISHRAVILAAIATGVSGLRNLSQGEDVQAVQAGAFDFNFAIGALFNAHAHGTEGGQRGAHIFALR